MEKSSLSRLSEFQELIQQLSLMMKVNQKLSDVLAEYDHRLYCLEEDNKRLLADYRAIDKKCLSLEKRYSEVLYKLSEVRNKS